jgi:hypothetical protein
MKKHIKTENYFTFLEGRNSVTRWSVTRRRTVIWLGVARLILLLSVFILLLYNAFCLIYMHCLFKRATVHVFTSSGLVVSENGSVGNATCICFLECGKQILQPSLDSNRATLLPRVQV